MQHGADKQLQSRRLYLRPIRRSQAEAILAGEAPEGILLSEGYPSRFTVEVMERLVGGQTQPGDENFFIVRRTDNRAIGGIGFWFPEGPSCPRLGYDVIEPLWGQGYATEALRILRDFLFMLPNVEAVRADTLIGNMASRRVMEKAGMELIAHMSAEEDGRPVELVLYEIKRPSSSASNFPAGS